jgi:hypothetical protein
MSKSEKYFVRIDGTRPLLMHAPVGLESRPHARRGEHISYEDEARRYLYTDEKGNIVMPAANIKACIVGAGANYKVPGRRTTYRAMLKTGIQVEPFPYVPLIHNGWEVDVRLVVVQHSRIQRARPKFNQWSLEFWILNRDPTMIPRDTLHQILVDAGQYYGLGDYRPEFGLFAVTKFEVVS